jgi:pimeloyl-ACP methyl ester carboxylesterase
MRDPNLEHFAESGLRYPIPPSSEGYITSGDCRIFFATFGDNGRDVLLLHGGMGNGTNWAKQIEPLVKSGYRVVSMDTRAHGRSTSGSQTLSYKVFAGDACLLAEHLRLQELIVVGWSDGACTALEIARTRPSLVAGVIFFACNVDPTGTLEFRMTESIRNCLIRHERDFANMSPTLERFADLQPKLDPMQKNEPNYGKEDLGRITVPIAVIQGDRDEFIKLDHARYIANSLGNSHFEQLEGLSHFAPIEDPERFNEAMLRCMHWLAATSPENAREEL